MLPRTEPRFKSQRARTRTQSGIPIYAPGRDRPIGYVRAGVFRKVVRGSIHFLHRPRAIAFDVSTLEDAERAGATLAEVSDVEDGHVYRAPLALVRAKGFPVSRGHGAQVALEIFYWSVDGEPSDADRRAEAEAAKNCQLDLFGGAS